ncbi:uncharacterized protein LOC129308512 [Prosopis cineraria]|uniref:uncharacterized protein LOC129308512 n=1 Tax=Prosopis cineraria TaxID=364024 RepID=UPI00241009E9|nr:uncharacterized protein LOC129308512 [Prosopis cineraria]
MVVWNRTPTRHYNATTEIVAQSVTMEYRLFPLQLQSFCTERSQQSSNKHHCHLTNDFETAEDHNLGKTPRCDHEIEHRSSGPLCDFKVCGGDHIASAIDNKHAESASTHACGSWEDQEKASCCKGCPDECPVVRASSSERDVGACCEGSSKESIEFSMAHACISLDKRGIGGCCKSYMMECCSKHGHLGAAFGGLPEIITEQV